MHALYSMDHCLILTLFVSNKPCSFQLKQFCGDPFSNKLAHSVGKHIPMVSTLTIDKMINVTLVYTRAYATNVDPGEAVGGTYS